MKKGGFQPNHIRLLRIIAEHPHKPGVDKVFPVNLRGFFLALEELELAEYLSDGWQTTEQGRKVLADFAPLPRPGEGA